MSEEGDGPDPLDLWRHELADIEIALEEGAGNDQEQRAQLLSRQVELEAWIAKAMNPNAAIVGEVVDADPELYRPTGGELVVSSPEELWRVLDAHDEDMILQEYQRRAIKAMVYSFQQGGKPVVDLSYQGVNEGIRLINATGKLRIKIDKDVREIRREIIDGIEYVIATAYSTEEVTGYGQFGVSAEPRWMKVNANVAAKQRENGVPVREETVDGTKVFRQFDIFAETKALNKAQRNALKIQIPERMRQAMIAMSKGDETALKTIRAGVGAEAVAELPPPVSSERAEQLNAEIRAIYGEIRGLSVLAYPPGRFGANHRRVQHDEALLETFRDELQATLDHMRSTTAER